MAHQRATSKPREKSNMSVAVLQRDDKARTESGPRSENCGRRDATINLRVTTRFRQLIDSAAAIVGKTRTDFMLESVRKHAEDVLLDQRFFQLDEQRYKDFLRALDAPPMPTEKLSDLMSRKAPWEK